MTQQNTDAQQPQQEQHVIASPNPTINDGRTPATVDATRVTPATIRPTTSVTAAPLKKKAKPKRRRTTHQQD